MKIWRANVFLLSLAAGLAATAQGQSSGPVQTTLTVKTAAGEVPATVVARNRICQLSRDQTAASCRLLLLVEASNDDDDESKDPLPRSLIVVGFGPHGDFEVETLAAGLSDEIETPSALDLDGDGSEEPLLGRPGELLRVVDGQVRILFARPFFELAPVEPLLHRVDVSGLKSGDALLPIPTVGKLEIVRLASGRSGEVISTAALPVRARRNGRAVRLSTPSVLQIPPAVDSPDAAVGLDLVTMPLEVSPGRWSVRRLKVASSAAATIESEDLFLSTPGPERPEFAKAVRVGGEPMLLVHALRSDKVGILERKKVRLYPLRADRTRIGNRSVVAVETISRIWQDLASELTDVDGDGVVDLLLLQREGFGGKKLQVEVVAGTGRSGSFSGNRSRRVLFPEPPFADWVWGHDVTGDGRSDLVLLSDHLAIHAGNGGSSGGAFSEQPLRRLQLEDAAARESLPISISVGTDGASSAAPEEEPEDDDSEAGEGALAKDAAGQSEGVSWSSPEWLDLDGDGSPELVLHGQSDGGDRIWVLPGLEVTEP